MILIGANLGRVSYTDDFSSDEDDDGAAADENSGPRCKALYHYSAKLNDELNLEPGE